MKKTKKILFFSENRNWGGSELLWSRAAIELINIGHTVQVVTYSQMQLPTSLEQVFNTKKGNLIKIREAKIPKYKRIINRFLPYKLRLLSKNRKEEIILQIQPDLLVINQGLNFNGVNTMLFARNNNIIYATISQAVRESLWPDQDLRQKMQLGYNKSALNFFVSEDNYKTTETQLAYSLPNAKVVRNPFNVDYNSKLNFPSGENYKLACVGRYDFSAKGQDILVRTFALQKWKERNLQLTFYGEGVDIENLKELILLHKLKNVKVSPYTSTSKIWEENHALILSSRYEGLPLVIVEAMLSKRFAIATDVSGNAELFEDNVTGFVAAAPRVKYVDDALERAWLRRNEWQTIGVLAGKAIRQEIPQNPAREFANELIKLTP
ncbi:glycosyltransferase family 4 protein [Leeuwenhoekiella sp. A16]|uniref:glycosyltransferase family 4 protein n=1 Tax=Leeuwenhoekiella sp. A16 TaxID=3141462 RepID=UPI003A809889